ncbi:uncharacterized DUF2314 family protein [Proteus hauseri ATCC 700826]|uniref:Uncharacterized DUF2314 family protein n=1 Tax=Proteus hauseri ATCC 700826 TaxID=1354271 RepID=A0AAJ3HVX1_PROHU|nr:DUF4026 domain-containing protein [Proteus hauseri]OAT51071.1 uncharacterized DUF2314 family protein [Proteus hauseri ATCC 700826]
MDNKQQYLDIITGQGKKEPSRIVAFPAQPLNYALIEQRLEQQSDYTEGEIDYLTEDIEDGFFYTCQQDGDELRFFVCLLARSPDYKICPAYSTDTLTPELLAHANATTQDILLETLFSDALHPLASYHHQLNFLNIIAPEMVLALDESAAGKALTPEWIRFQLETPDLYPEVESLYVIHAVYDTENDPPTMFWFHTHGLERCGLTEVDLVIPSMLESYYGIPDIFRCFVNNSINHQQIEFGEPMLCGQTSSGLEYLVALPYEEGIRHVNQSTPLDNLRPLEEMRYDTNDAPSGIFLGDMADRDEYHQHPSSMLFRTNEENPVLETFFKGYEEQQAIMLLRTNEETYEMSEKAKLRWEYFVSMFDNYNQPPVEQKNNLFSKWLSKGKTEETDNPWQFMIKFGIPYGKNEKEKELEHMWFIPQSLDGNTVYAKLINVPFYIEDMDEGKVYPIDIALITDWVITYQDNNYTPNNIYQLFSHQQTH